MEFFALVFDLIDEYFELNSRTILRVDEGVDDCVKLIRALIQVNIQGSELFENEFFSLSIFEEEQSDKILRCELDEFLGRHNFFLAEVIFEHESVHGSVEFDLEVGVTFEFIFVFEDFYNFLGQIPIDIGLDIVLVGMFADFQVKLDVFDVFQFFLVFYHGAAYKPVFVQFLLDTSLRGDQGIDGFVDFGVGVVIVKLLLNTLFGHLSGKLYGGHVGEPLLLGFLSLSDHLVELDFCHVIGFMDDQFGLVSVSGEQEVILINHFYDLVLVERRYEFHQKVLVILQYHNPELLEHMLQVSLLLHRSLHHRV